MSNKNKKKKKRSKAVTTQAVVPPPPPPPGKNYFYGLFDKGWKIVVAIGIVFGIIVSWIAIRDQWFVPKHDLYEKENVVSGQIKSPKISDNVELKNDSLLVNRRFYYDETKYDYPIIRGIYIKDLSKQTNIIFHVGKSVMDLNVGDLYNSGDNFFYGLNIGQCPGTELILAAMGDRLYVSCKFTDFKSELAIGEMEFNHWKIYKGRYLDYRCTDESFEVIDNQGYLVFSISYLGGEGRPYLQMAGYLLDPDGCTVLSYTAGLRCFEKDDPHWKLEAEKEIYKNKAVLKSKCD